MREYIYRYHNPQKFEYLHPMMKDLLEETFGVMVFQEDVIKVAHYFGGLSMGEADTLRRAMSLKYRSNNKFDLIRNKFLKNCKDCGHSDELAAEVWRQMESFAGYSFCKAHSASFAMESFQDLFLKAYYPMEFMVGVIRNFGGFYSTELYFIELRKTGANINLPCINHSEYQTTIRGQHVYMGLEHLKAFRNEFGRKIIEERKLRGNYLHLQDFIARTNITSSQLEILISIGAFRFTGKTKKQLLWEADFLVTKNKGHSTVSTLFEEKPVEFHLPDFTDDSLDDVYDEKDILGFPLRNPFEMVDDDPYKYVLEKDIVKNIGKNITMLVYFIKHKVVPTKNDTTMSFGTFLDAEMNWVDTVHFPQSYERYPFESDGFYRITGTVVQDSVVKHINVCSVKVNRMEKVGYKMKKYANL
jgi:DNA polymerase-3 subunit alpha